MATNLDIDAKIDNLWRFVFHTVVDKSLLVRIGCSLTRSEIIFKRHQAVFAASQVSDHIYIIKEGSVKISLRSDAQRNRQSITDDKCIAIVGRNEIIGEDCLFKSLSNKYTAIVESLTCTCYEINSDFIRSHMSVNVSFSQYFSQLIKSRNDRRSDFIDKGKTYNNYILDVHEDERYSLNKPNIDKIDKVEYLKTRKIKYASPLRTGFLHKRIIGDKVFNYLNRSTNNLIILPNMADLDPYSDIKTFRKQRRMARVKPVPKSLDVNVTLDFLSIMRMADSKARVQRIDDLDKTLYHSDKKRSTSRPKALHLELTGISTYSPDDRGKTYTTKKKTETSLSIDTDIIRGRLSKTETTIGTPDKIRTRSALIPSKHNLFRRRPARPEIEEQFFKSSTERFNKPAKKRSIFRLT